MLDSVWGEAAEEERLRALADLGISGTGREERFDRITRLARQLFGVERVAITLVDRDVQWFKSEPPSFCNTTIAQPGLTVAEDTRRDLRFARNPYVTGSRTSASTRTTRASRRPGTPSARSASSTCSRARSRRSTGRC
jgi:GAF domain-containing protein